MTDLQVLIEHIHAHPFSQGMSDAHIRTLAGCAREVNFAAGATLFREGDDATTFYWIRSGKVAMEIHTPPNRTVMFDTRGPDDALGWSWAVAPYRWSCDARAVTAVDAVVFDADCLRAEWEHDSELALEMYQRFVSLMHRNLQATRLQLMDVYGRR